jgi:hypothetical protein
MSFPRLDLGVIGRDPAAYQPVGGRQALEHIDLNHEIRLSLKMFGGIKRRRTRPNNGNAEWIVRSSQWSSHGVPCLASKKHIISIYH